MLILYPLLHVNIMNAYKLTLLKYYQYLQSLYTFLDNNRFVS